MRFFSMKTTHRLFVTSLACLVGAPTAVYAEPAWSQRTNVGVLESLSSIALITGTSNTHTIEQAMRGGSTAYTLSELQEIAQAAKLPLQAQQVPLDILRRRGTVAIVHLRAPNRYAALQAIGSKYALLSGRIVDIDRLRQYYTGRALVLKMASNAKLSFGIGEPIQVVHVTSTGKEVVQTVLLANRGQDILKLRVRGTSCGCTSARLGTEDIAPGQTTSLTIKRKTDGWGDRTETVTLQSSDPTRPYAMIALHVKMPKQVVPNPSRLVIAAQEGSATKRAMYILLPNQASIVKATTRHTFIKPVLKGREQIDGGTLQRIEIVVNKDAPVGPFTDAVTFQLQGAEVPHISVAVEGGVEPDVFTVPSQVFMGSMRDRSVNRKHIILESRSAKPFSIKSIKVQTAFVSVKASVLVRASSHAVEINIAAEGEPGTLVQDNVLITLSNGQVISVPVVGRMATSQGRPVGQFGSSLQIGLPAPDFSYHDMAGIIQRSSDLVGKKNLLVTFFPKCFTGGCANHLSSLRDQYTILQANDIEVIAVSVDPAEGEEGQRAFAKQWNLPFPLIPDTERKLSFLYGAAERPTDLARRMTVLIDKQGIVRLVDTNVNVTTHGADMVAKMRELGIGK